MRVLMLIHNMAYNGGNFHRALPIARALVSLGHEVTLLAGRATVGVTSQSTTESGVRIIQPLDLMPKRVRHGGLSPFDIAGRMRHVCREKYDIVHGFSHRPAVSLPALLARQHFQIPYIFDWADMWGYGGIASERHSLSGRLLGVMDHHWERTILSRADALTVISTDLYKRARNAGIGLDCLRLIPVGANTRDIVPLDKAKMRTRYGLPQQANILVHIGFSSYDARLLGETFVYLLSLVPNTLLVTTGQLPHAARQIINATGHADQIRAFGMVPYEQLGEILACGDVMLLPFSHKEVNLGRFPNRFGDYLAAGRPIATNTTPDVGSIVEAEGVGIVAEDEPYAFARAIRGLLANKAEQMEMGYRARALAEGQYSWRAMAERVNRLYIKMVA